MKQVTAAVLGLLVVCGEAGATFLRGETVPVDRLIANVKAHFPEYTDQAEAYYLLGRLESLAFSGDADSVSVYKNGRPNDVPQVTMSSWVNERKVNPGGELPHPLSAVTRAMFFSSIDHYRSAIAINSKVALYHFSFGWMADQGKRFETQLGLPPTQVTGNLSPPTWRMLAIREYGLAYDLADSKAQAIGPGPVIFLEAGQALLIDLSNEIFYRTYGHTSRADREYAAKAEQRLRLVSDNLRRVEHLPRIVTPLIFSTRPDTRLADLLSSGTVAFDLDGFGDGRRWPWVQADTAMLVWDPSHEGRIVSGRQLFGSVTWWMFWKSGFDVLAALDDNGDGWLTGTELDGIGVWQDRNGNGIADPGEVVAVREFGVQGLAIRSDEWVDGVESRRGGVAMRDGRVLTIFDWVPTGLPPAISAPGVR